MSSWANKKCTNGGNYFLADFSVRISVTGKVFVSELASVAALPFLQLHKNFKFCVLKHHFFGAELTQDSNVLWTDSWSAATSVQKLENKMLPMFNCVPKGTYQLNTGFLNSVKTSFSHHANLIAESIFLASKYTKNQEVCVWECVCGGGRHSRDLFLNSALVLTRKCYIADFYN